MEEGAKMKENFLKKTFWDNGNAQQFIKKIINNDQVKFSLVMQSWSNIQKKKKINMKHKQDKVEKSYGKDL